MQDMSDLLLRKEFQSDQLRETAISFYRNDKTGAIEIPSRDFFDITYPSIDVQKALNAISTKKDGRPIALIAERGRGKTHVLACMHHALSTPQDVEEWARMWDAQPDVKTDLIHDLHLRTGFHAITESMQDNTYSTLWDLLFNHHPEGLRFRGRFEESQSLVPPRALIEAMLALQPVALILDEFQSWFDGRQDMPENDAPKWRSWAFNFIQTLSEIATERPDLLLLIVAVRNNATDAYAQIHRNDPFLIDFKDTVARTDHQRIALHRIFHNRQNIDPADIAAITAPYREARFHLFFQQHEPASQAQHDAEVIAAWPFSPELFTLLEDQILRSSQAQGLRDLLRILVLTFTERSASCSILTPSSYSLARERSASVQTLIDVVIDQNQSNLRQVAFRNFGEIREAGIAVDADRINRIMSALWLRSLSIDNNNGATAQQLHVDSTNDHSLDENIFRDELNQIIANSFNIHQIDVNGETRYTFREEENPRARLLASARNASLFANDEDITELRKHIRMLLSPPNKEHAARVIVFDPHWKLSPWKNVLDVQDNPERWERPVLIVAPEYPDNLDATLGSWLKQHVSVRRNTVRFLLPETDKKSIFTDPEIIQCIRIITLANRWNDPKYTPTKTEFNKKLNEILDRRFTRFAVLHYWNYQDSSQCKFTIEPVKESIGKMNEAVEQIILNDLFLVDVFKERVLALAQSGKKVGDLLNELIEPPGNSGQEAIIYLGETGICEQLLRIVAAGAIVLNVNGSLQYRNGDEESGAAYERLRRVAFKTGRELREMELVPPNFVGLSTLGAAPSNGVEFLREQSQSISSPQIAFSTPTTLTTPPTTSSSPIGAMPLPQPVISKWRRRRSEAKKPLNLVSEVERWAPDIRSNIPIARLEFTDLSAAQLKDIISRLPSGIQQVILEIETDDGE